MISYFKNRIFVFSWFYLIALFILFSIFFGLSIWQLIRAAEKEDIRQAYELAFNADEVEISSLGNLSDNIFRSVIIKGEYIEDGEILIDNIIVNRKAGYYVMSAFKYQTANNERIIYVNRGWVSQGKDRADIPLISYPEDEITIRGKIYLPRSKPFMLGVSDASYEGNESESKVKLYFDKNTARKKLENKYEIEDVIIRLDAKDRWGYDRNFPGFSAKIAMHYGYFVHWLIFAIFTLVIYIYVSFRKIDDSDVEHEF